MDAPERVSVMGVLALPDEGEMPTVPADGVPEQPVPPVPETAMVKVDVSPPPEILMLPLVAPGVVGLNRIYNGNVLNVVPV